MPVSQRADFLDMAPHMDALLWPSLRADKESAWHGHVSFAHWVVSATRPATVVELGSHNGVSYAAFCNAVEREGIPARCYAVDTWKGDEHAGSYAESVYQDLAEFNDRRYASFSTLLRCYFDEALATFADGSVDLLHIDGLHTYDAVKHDFDTWLPKMSPRGVVLFHDTEVFTGDFGVWKLWGELTRRYPSFNFGHSAGLGVLAVGPDVPQAVYDLCNQPRLDSEPATQRGFMMASYAATRAGQAEAESDARPSRNVALGCVAMQSSSLDGPATPGGAVDGTRNGGYGFHTASEVNPWWMVDLGQARTIRRIVVYNRLTDGCAERARRLKVMVSADGVEWTTIYRHAGAPFGGVDGHPLQIVSVQWYVRFVRLQLDDQNFLHLDEVEIYD